MEDFTLIQYLRNQLATHDRREVEHWINASVANNMYFSKLKRSWEISSQIPELQNPDIDKAWRKLDSSLAPRRKTFQLGLVASIAAAVVILIVSVFVLHTSSELFRTEKWITVESGDSLRRIVLADSSIVWLNRHSSIAWSGQYGKKLREVIMHGEAFFDVRKNPKLPFVVNTSKTKVKVLGTSFNIRMDMPLNKIKVALVTGKIELTDNRFSIKKYTLLPGNIATIEGNRQLNITSTTSVNNHAWLTDKLVFRNQTLGEIAEILQDYYHVTIHFANKELQYKRVTATFYKQDLTDVLFVLQKTVSFRFDVRSVNNILLK